MFCESCGKEIPDDSKFCEYCGNPVIFDNFEFFDDYDSSIEERINDYPNIDSHIEKQKSEKNNNIPKRRFNIKRMAIVFILLLIVFVGFSFASNILKEKPRVDPNISTNLPASIPSNDPLLEDATELEKSPSSLDTSSQTSFTDINEGDFAWYFDLDFMDVPLNSSELQYAAILGEWKVMAINYESETAEIYYSFANMEEYNSLEGARNTSLSLKHQFVEYEGEIYPFDEEDSKDMILGYYDDGLLELFITDEKIVDSVFWEKDGKNYGQGYYFRDHDNDGIGDLELIMAFVR